MSEWSMPQFRCQAHPHRDAVALCDVCGRGLCLSCAVPVRGQVLGRECLSEVLGPLAPAQEFEPGRRTAPGMYLIGLGFLTAVVGGALPWTTFGVGSGRFGGWGYSPLRWSLMAAAAGAIGMACWLAGRWVEGVDGGAFLVVLGLLAALVGAGAILHALRPPPFTHAWLGPWVALGGAVASIVGVVWLAIERYRPSGAPAAAS